VEQMKHALLSIHDKYIPSQMAHGTFIALSSSKHLYWLC